jgi:hypothetical protein
MFVATLKVKNDSLKKAGSNVKIMMNKKELLLRVDMRRPVDGAYYLNGVRLFDKTLDADRQYSLLRFDIKNKKAVLNKPDDSVIEQFHGRQVFKALKRTEMVGRWVWDTEKRANEIAKEESESMTAEDSLAYKQGLAELERANSADNAAKDAANATANNNSKSNGGLPLRWISLAVSGAALFGGTAMAILYNSKAKTESENFKKEVESGNNSNYSTREKNSKDFQNMRTVGVGIAIAGGIGVGLTFLF